MNPPFRLFFTLAVALPLSAQAQSLTLNGPPTLQSSAHYATLGSKPAAEETAYDALQEFRVTNELPVSLSVPSPLNLFCVEVGQDAPGTGGQPNAVSYTILALADADENRAATSFEAYSGMPVGGIGTATATKLEDLYGYVFPSYSNSSPLNISLTQAGITGNAGYDSAVFQLAVWQVAETGTLHALATSGTTGSGFYAYVPSNTPTSGDKTTLISDTDKLLAAVAADTNVLPLNLDVLHSANAQDYILPDPTGSYLALNPIPEPSVTALGLGLAAAAALLRRRKSVLEA